MYENDSKRRCQPTWSVAEPLGPRKVGGATLPFHSRVHRGLCCIAWGISLLGTRESA